MSREKIRELFEQSIKSGSPTDWFLDVYELADRGQLDVPWDDQKPNPWLVKWWQQHGEIVPQGALTLDVACGLGDNGEFLARQGLKVTGCDISPKALELAQKRFPQSDIKREHVDMLSPPTRYNGRFDFVSEVYTLQALPAEPRKDLLRGIASSVKPGGLLLIVARHRPAGQAPEDSPPWSLSRAELDVLLDRGFKGETYEELQDHYDDREVFRVLASYRREV